MRAAINQYIDNTNRKVFLEYVLLKNVNDSKNDAHELAEYVQSFDKPYLLHINLIPYNETNTSFESNSQHEAEVFRNELARNKTSVTIRKSLGKEIKGACGQLAGK